MSAIMMWLIQLLTTGVIAHQLLTRPTPQPTMIQRPIIVYVMPPEPTTNLKVTQ